MNQHIKCSKTGKDEIILPLPSMSVTDRAEIALYARFMRHLRHVPNSRMEIKVLSAIQFTADMLGHCDAYVAKVLVDLGLRAPRVAFPAEFLKFVDAALMRSAWDVGGPSKSIIELREYWDVVIEEDKFAPISGEYSVVNERVLLH